MKSRIKNNAIRAIVCETCGTVVTKRMQKGMRFCSRECAGKSPRPSRQTGEIRHCAICQKEVYIPQWRLGKPHYFCSPEHQIEWQGRNKLTYTCKTCGNPFRKSASFEKFGKVLYCSPACRDADPDWQSMLIEMNASQQRGNQTEPERIGYAILDALGVEYLPQHVIGGKFCVDAFIPSASLVVQVDGDYWHGNPERFPVLDKRQQRRVRLDQSQDSYMRTCGYAVLRIWESILRAKPDEAREAIQHALAPIGPTIQAPDQSPQ